MAWAGDCSPGHPSGLDGAWSEEPRLVLTTGREGLSMSHLTFGEAGVVGLLQGVTELFPLSSLGHSVLIPALVGGSWAQDLNVSKPESPYLAFIVGLHVATAVAMIAYFWRDWVRIIRGLFSSISQGRAETPDQKLAWMIILATIPVGIAGLALEHLCRIAFTNPTPPRTGPR